MADRLFLLEGQRELLRAFNKTEKETKTGVRAVMAGIAQPVADTIEQNAKQDISRIGEKWPVMRIGVTQKLIYLAPKERSRLARRNPRRYVRREFSEMFATRAIDPAEERHAPGYEAAVSRALDIVCDRFNHGGPL